jgi:hypothetical protein
MRLTRSLGHPPLRSLLVGAALVAWAAAVGLWLARAWFLLPPGVVAFTHEKHHYVYRLVEFRDLLAAGYWSPQWASNFRRGIGSPYFSYYQPGFFYLASLVPWSVEPQRALGCAVAAVVVVGFLATFALVRSRFGPFAGLVGATALVVAPYTRTEIFVRGDLSELTAMMLVPFVFHRFLDGLERGRGRDLAGLTAGVAAVIVTHPAVGLLLAAALGASFVVLVLPSGRWAAGLGLAAAMAFALGLAGFYVLPVVFELRHVAAERAWHGPFHYSQFFVHLHDLFDPGLRRPFPTAIGSLLLALASFNVGAYLWRPSAWDLAQRRFLALWLLVAGLMLFLMTPASGLVWEHVPALQRIQFPPRALALLTPALACLAGAAGGVARTGWRPAALGVLALTMTAWSLGHANPRHDHRFTHVVIARDIAEAEYFSPDITGELGPRGATISGFDRVPPEPVVTGDDCVVSDFRRAQGHLTFRVSPASVLCFVTLPQLFFPLGWQAALDGDAHRVSLGPAWKGLMQVAVRPGPGGVVDVRFTMTPMRRLGWVLTLASAVVGLGALRILAPRRVP